MNDLEHIANKNRDYASAMKDIQKHIQTRKIRIDYVCWNCRKAAGRLVKTCLYCSEEQ